RKHNLVAKCVTPAALVLVRDLDARSLAFQIGHVPRRPPQDLILVTGCDFYRILVNDKARVVELLNAAAADEHMNIGPCNFELRRQQFAEAFVAAVKTVRNARAGKTLQRLLLFQRALRRARAECIALDRPRAEGVTFEVGEYFRLFDELRVLLA